MSVASLGTFVTYNPIAVSVATTLAEAGRLMRDGGFHHLPVIDDQRRVIGILSEIDVASAPKRLNAKVEQAMVQSVVTIEADASPRVALEAILSNGFHSAPIVQDGRLLGMVTSTDFLREFSYGSSPVFHDPVSWHMSPALAHIDMAATLIEATDVINRSRCSFAAVVDGGRAVGAISKRDCHRARHAALDSRSGEPRSSRVADLLPAEQMLFAPDLALGVAVGKLLEYTLRAAVVADRLGRVSGILSEDDVLAAMLEHVC